MLGFRRLLLVALALAAPTLWAHPHVWISAKATVAITAGFVDKVEVEWTFDELFTSLLLLDNDANGDGKLSADESDNVRKTYFDNLKSYGFFSHLTWGTKTLVVKAVQGFQAEINAAGRAVYRFNLPVGQRLDGKVAFKLAFYDETFYTDLVFDKGSPVTVTVLEGGAAGVVVKPNPAKAFYGGQVVPVEAVISWRPS